MSDFEPRPIRIEKTFDSTKQLVKKVHFAGCAQKFCIEPGTDRKQLHWVVMLECSEKPKPVPVPNPKPVQKPTKQKAKKTASHKPVASSSKQVPKPQISSNQVSTASTTTSAAPKPPPKHYLRIDQCIARQDASAYAVRKDSVPVQISFVEKKYPISDSAPEIARISLNICKEITVAQYIEKFKAYRRHCYVRTKEGFGCLYFVQVLASDMETEKLIDGNSSGYKVLMGLKRETWRVLGRLVDVL